MRDIIKELETKLRDDLVTIDVGLAYDDMLNECYSFSSVGGPFSHMQAAEVLEEMDPTAYRCGRNDWVDSEDMVEVDCDYYYLRQAEGVKDALVSELQDEIDDLQSQLEDLDPADEECDNFSSGIAELEELMTTLRKHSF